MRDQNEGSHIYKDASEDSVFIICFDSIRLFLFLSNYISHTLNPMIP